MHEEIVRQLPKLFLDLDRERNKKTRQIFITTHSEAMLGVPGIGANEVLRLKPYAEGTVIHTADEQEIRLMEDGLTAAEVLLPKTRPDQIEQLSMWNMS